jgi:LysR family transcriptional regulator of beta-lactamase
LAVNWLIPRLAGFYDQHPEVEVRMATGGAMRPVRDDWTCTIRRDTAAWPGYIAEELLPSTLIPVCTPALAEGLRNLADLRKATLIFVPHLADDWRIWFEAAGLRAPIRPRAEVSFDNTAMAMQAALDGVGVAIAQPLYVTGALKAGRLFAPFPVVAKKHEAWYFEYRHVRAEEPALLSFRNWFRTEAELQRQSEAGLINQPANSPHEKPK